MTPQRAGRIALDLVLVAAAVLGAMKLFELGLHQLAATAFWKTWVAEHSGAAKPVPALVVGVACGVLVGVALGGFAGARAQLLAYWAGGAVIALDFGAMIVTDGVLTPFALAPLCIAAGMLFGAVLSGKLMPSPAE